MSKKAKPKRGTPKPADQPEAQPKPRCLPCGHIECHGDDCPFL